MRAADTKQRAVPKINPTSNASFIRKLRLYLNRAKAHREALAEANSLPDAWVRRNKVISIMEANGYAFVDPGGPGGEADPGSFKCRPPKT